MDLGIKGKRALVCAASKGLGRGSAEALAAEGVDLIINARGAEALQQTAADLTDRYGVSVQAVAADITTEAGRAKVLDVAGPIDILVNNAGGPPPGHWTEWTREDFIKALDANLLTAVALIQATVPGMIERKWGRVVNITSAAVRSPIPILGLSNTARTGLTGFVAGLSRDVAKHGVVVNNLLPGLHATDRADSLDGSAAQAEGISIEQARARRQSGIPTGTYGSAADFGAACAFLCSQQAKFIIGQNLLVDGGTLNVTM
ncbi:SDR family oxidoreductase [Paracoccus xiamenensis]|uniref:SDR family oxidoreductase n=1 Tax=Paracoccus xiamenensis TaxID=2714901 RepID=UPI00140B35C5|nr:SDR family oxidoreductase [Paracoccus xiamenensis]NHF72904.1 SDR family oxidoreductase [Paracoccus xiamenensis]